MDTYESLASIMLQIHGSLKEVKFKEKTRQLVLIFGDGTELAPYSSSQRRNWYEKHLHLLANAGFGGDPFDGLTFGYDGTGSKNLSVFLKACGFANATVVMSGEKFTNLPVVLKPDGNLYSDFDIGQ